MPVASISLAGIFLCCFGEVSRVSRSMSEKYSAVKHIVLGVSGSIAAYKAAFLLRLLQGRGCCVRVCMTQKATRFITPLTMSILSRFEVPVGFYETPGEGIEHIKWARWADCVLVVPATANCMSKIGRGQCDDFLTSLCLASDVPVVCAPAMNCQMWDAPATKENLELLEKAGVLVLAPDFGSQACGEIGEGRMMQPGAILDKIIQLSMLPSILRGSKVVVTAGPTHEPIDAVRFLGNRSSGRMGFALAASAARAGAQVFLITGPSCLPTPRSVARTNVVTANQMLSASIAACQGGADMFIGVAAVSDYRPRNRSKTKMKRTAGSMKLDLVLADDVLLGVRTCFPDMFCVGFVAEPDQLEKHALDKLNHKGVDMVVANRVGEGLGIDESSNQVCVYARDFKKEFPKMSKVLLSDALILAFAEYRKSTKDIGLKLVLS